MRRAVLLFVVISVIIATGGIVYAETKADLDENWRAIADTRAYPGEIYRPLICPADTTLISFEIHNKSEVQLYIYDTKTFESHRIQSPSLDTDAESYGFAETPADRDMAWRPVAASNGAIWLSFIGNATGNPELYLYNLTADKYYLMRAWNDTSGIAAKGEPGWSPDGKCLTYTTTINGDADIYVICGMDNALKDPTHFKVAERHTPLVEGSGDQFGAVWCPAPMTGYIAYNYIGEGGQQCEVRLYDPRTSRSFGLSEGTTGNGHFAPVWSPNGKQLGFYQYDISGGGSLTDRREPGGDKYGLSLATVKQQGDSLVMAPQRGGRTGRSTVVLDVAPSLDRYLGLAWLPDGRYLLLSTYNEASNNPFGTVHPVEWGFGSPRRDWLGSFGGGTFKYPKDVGIVKNSITFSYSEGQKRILAYGQLKPKESYFKSPDYAEVTAGRRDWWKNYSEHKDPGYFQRLWQGLMKPVAGPDFFVNKRIVPVAAALTFAIIKITESDPEPLPPRNWGQPGWPVIGKAARRFGLRVRF